jgi:NhaP-type Na+/H+ or K+/H+ antiporter
MELLPLFLALIFAHSLVSARLDRTVVTAPILFTAAGIGALLTHPSLRGREGDLVLWLTIAEVGLVLLLFSDASRTDLRVLRNIRNLPARLLTIGMLLTLAAGALAALGVFPGLSFWEAGILAAVLAPTDAGLGQVIVSSPRVPLRIRQALNVEAGLNDGLSVPFLLFFIAVAAGATGAHDASLARFAVEQLGYGVLIGGGIGLGGGWLLGLAAQHGWMASSWRQFGVVVLPAACALASEAAGASMFIAAFAAGLAVQVRFPDVTAHSLEFTEDWGQLLNLSVFFLFGMMVARDWALFSWTHALYAVLSLTVVRMLPVAIALAGTRLSRATVAFVGWFGPRGLASIVLGLVYLEHDTGLAGEDTVRLAVMATVLLSIFAHGFSASPGMAAYARHVERLPPGAPERRT